MLGLLETGKALYVLMAVCAMGIGARITTAYLYKRLLKESNNMTMTKHKGLKDFKQSAENTYRSNQGIKESKSWLQHQMYEFRFMGISLTRWNRRGFQLTWLCLLLGATGSFLSYWNHLDTYYVVLYGGSAILMAMLTMLFDHGEGEEQREQLTSSLLNYIDNILCPRLAKNGPEEPVREEVSRNLTRQPILTRGKRRNAEPLEQEPRNEVDYLKRSLEQIAASREKSRALDERWIQELKPEEVQLINDILKEYL